MFSSVQYKKPTAEYSKLAWNRLGNLAFYPGFSPTFFYFNWLLDGYDAGRGPNYVRQANAIGSGAITNLNKGNFLSEDFNDLETITQRFIPLLKVIQKAIAYERANELAYFKQKYNELTKVFTKEDWKKNPELNELKTALADAANGKEFNYGRFMSLINILLQGRDNAKAVIAYETRHLKEIEDGIKSLKDARKNQIEGLAQSGQLKTGTKLNEKNEKVARTVLEVIDDSEKKIDKQLKISYLEHGNYSEVRGVKTHFEDVYSADVKIAHWITACIQKLWNNTNFHDKIRKYILDNNIIETGRYGDVELYVTEAIISAVQDEAIKNIPKILNDQYKKFKTSNLIKQFDISKMINIRSNYQIEGWNSNYGQYGNRIKFFSDLSELTDITDAHAADLYKALNDIILRCNQNKRNKKKNEEDDQFVLDRITEMNLKKEIDDIRNLINKFSTVKNQYNAALKNQNTFFKKHTDGWQKEFKDSKGKKVTVSITLDDNGQVKITGLDELKNLYGYEVLLGDKSINSDSLTQQLAVLKTKANERVKAMLLEIIQSDEQKMQGELIRRLRSSFEHITVSVGGPKFSELLTGIQFRTSGGDLSVQWTGGKNSKNDVVTLTLKAPDGTMLESIEKDLNQIINSSVKNKFTGSINNIGAVYAHEFSTVLSNKAEELQRKGKTYSEQQASLHKYKELKNLFLHRMSKQDEKQDEIDKLYVKANDAMDTYVNRWTKKNNLDPNSEEVKKLRSNMRQRILKTLRDSFYVSTTVKTYNQYDNNIGFLGGSLGTTPFEQLTRLSDIFESAGIPLSGSDMAWLLGAITNCSPISVIGDKDKNSIEHYLGAMAAFALFDEGAAEATLATMEEEVRNKQTVPSILHLYKVNGIFVPGSYVLQEVANELEYCINQMNFAVESLNRGAGVTIINKVTYGDLPNSKIKQQDESWSLDPTPWESMATTAASKIEIKILFLAGLRDIMRNINTAMGNIELPQ